MPGLCRLCRWIHNVHGSDLCRLMHRPMKTAVQKCHMCRKPTLTRLYKLLSNTLLLDSAGGRKKGGQQVEREAGSKGTTTTTVTPLMLLYHFYWKRAHFIVLENKWFHVVSKNHIQNVNEPLSWVVLYQYPQEGNESYKHPVTLQSDNHTCPHSIIIRKINTFIWKVHTHMIGGLDVKCVHQNIMNHCNGLYFSPSRFYIG